MPPPAVRLTPAPPDERFGACPRGALAVRVPHARHPSRGYTTRCPGGVTLESSPVTGWGLPPAFLPGGNHRLPSLQDRKGSAPGALRPGPWDGRILSRPCYRCGAARGYCFVSLAFLLVGPRRAGLSQTQASLCRLGCVPRRGRRPPPRRASRAWRCRCPSCRTPQSLRRSAWCLILSQCRTGHLCAITPSWSSSVSCTRAEVDGHFVPPPPRLKTVRRLKTP